MIEYAAKILSRKFTPTTPVVEPVTLAEAKEWAMVDYADKDTQITKMITAARRLTEKKLGGISLLPGAGWFVVEVSRETDVIGLFPHALDYTAVSSITVNYLTDGQADQLKVLDTDYYYANGVLTIGSYGTYRINYSVAYSDFPQDLKEAIMMIVAYRINFKGDQTKEGQQRIPEDAQEIIDSYKIPWL